MTNFIRYTLLLAVLGLLAACQPSAKSTLPATSLLTPAIPTTIVAYVDEYPTDALPQHVPIDMKDAAGFENQFAIADRFLLSLTGVSTVPGDQVYRGWLTSEDGALLALGQLNPQADGELTFEWTSPTGENLLTRFTGFEITLESADGNDTPSGKIVYAGKMDADQAAKARLLFVTNTIEPATPLNSPFIPGLLAQLDIAIQHIQNAQNAEAIGATEEMLVHLEHVINIFEGAGGARFQDYNGDGAAQDPGDGFGVKGYTRQAAAVLTVPELADSIESSVDGLQDQALAILQSADRSQAADSLALLHAAAEALRDDSIAELYRQAEKIAWFSVQPVP